MVLLFCFVYCSLFCCFVKVCFCFDVIYRHTKIILLSCILKIVISVCHLDENPLFFFSFFFFLPPSSSFLNTNRISGRTFYFRDGSSLRWLYVDLFVVPFNSASGLAEKV